MPELQERTYELAKKIYIKHIILNIPNSPPDWVYELLDRESRSS